MCLSVGDEETRCPLHCHMSWGKNKVDWMPLEKSEALKFLEEGKIDE